MNPTNALELHERILRFAIGQEDTTDFWDWFMPISWDLTFLVDRHTKDMADTLQHLLFEMSDGVWTEDEVKTKARAMLGTTHLRFPLENSTVPPSEVYADSLSGEPIRMKWTAPKSQSGMDPHDV